MGLEQITNIKYKAPPQLQVSQTTVAYGVAKLLGYEGYVLRFQEQQDWVYDVLDPNLIGSGNTRAQARVAEIRRGREQDSYEIRVLRVIEYVQITQTAIDQAVAEILKNQAIGEFYKLLDGKGNLQWLIDYLTFLAKLKKPE